MEKPSHKEKSSLDDISLADISKEAQKLHEEHNIDTLLEASDIDEAERLLLGYVKKSIMTLSTPLGEVLEKLDKRRAELLGEEWAKEEEV